jgi:uncharacterized DUF497 family protein
MEGEVVHTIVYIQMRFAWDERKNRTNRAKHKVSFETAISIFDDPYAISIQDRFVTGEERWQTLGLIEGTVVLLVAHLVEVEGNEESIRIISARKATPREREIYAQSRQKTE